MSDKVTTEQINKIILKAKRIPFSEIFEETINDILQKEA